MKRLAYLMIALLVVLVVALPASAAGWSQRVSGGMSYAYYGGALEKFTVTLSAWEKADGTHGGEGQYYYEPSGIRFHLDVTQTCFGTVSGGAYDGAAYAVGIGTVRAQGGSPVGGYGAIAVAEGGKAGDGVRVKVNLESTTLETTCSFWAGNSSFFARAVDGNFHIRSK
jgi:hypothetical protein